jgi:hypothetical protein
METEADRWGYLISLEDELLLGGVILSEWCTFISCEADTAFALGANLSAILTAVAAIETHLRAESVRDSHEVLAKLIDGAGFSPGLRSDLHRLRRYRNNWVHVNDPWDDHGLLQEPIEHEEALAEMARLAMRTMRHVLYSNPWA